MVAFARRRPGLTRAETKEDVVKVAWILTLLAAIFPLEMIAQSDTYNFYTVDSVPAQGNATWYNSTFAILESPQDPTSSGPFSCAWPAGTSGTNPDMTVGVTFDPSASGSYSGSCSITYYDDSEETGGYITATLTLSGTLAYQSIFDPKYQVTSIIYAPPGNKSSDGYTDTTTDGTITTIGSSFTYGQSITFTEGIKAFGSGGSASQSFGTSQTTSNSDAFAEVYVDGTGVTNLSESTNPDAINHNLDLFLIWLDPQITVAGTAPTPSAYSVGIQPTANGETPLPDIVEIEALVMEPNSAGVTTVPATWLNQQYNSETGQYTPGLAAICKNLKTSEYNAGTCTLADQCGCVAADFAPILKEDPLLYYNGINNALDPYPNTASPLLADTSGETTCGTLPTSASNKCRYVPVPSEPGSTTPESTSLSGPDCAGCGSTGNLFSQGENQTTTITLGESSSYTVSDSIKAGTTAFSMTDTDTWTWTESESLGTQTGTGVTLTVTLNSGTVGCGQTVDVYEDTVFHTFVFQQPSGSQGASCTTATATPTFSPAAGTYTDEQTVTISTGTTGAAIYYTTNGTTPTTSSTLYTGPITVSKTETVKAISHFSGWATSSVGSAAYTID
jgi:hypothetical protein